MGVNVRKKVVIIGGGFGGLAAAKKLANTNIDVLIIDKANHHLFQPLLYQVASAALSPGDIATPIREVVSYAKNIKVIQAEVSTIDKVKKNIVTTDDDCIQFDHLVIAIGVKPNYYNHPEWEALAPGLKSLDDALTIRNQVLSSFEKAEKEQNAINKQKLMNFVVVGGGPTGVELAGAFAEISKQTLVNDFRNINSTNAQIFLIEGGSHILASYDKKLSQKAEDYLKRLGVIILKGNHVKEITKDYICIGEKQIETENIIWAAGNKAPSILKQLDGEVDSMGRVIVNEFLLMENSKDIYVIGDAAHFKSEGGAILPGLAPVATQQGNFVGNHILGKSKNTFKYFDKGSMATIGRFKAIMELGQFKTSGLFAWLSWCFVHVFLLIDFRNKIVVFTQWAIAFFFFKRGVRIINGASSKRN